MSVPPSRNNGGRILRVVLSGASESTSPRSPLPVAPVRLYVVLYARTGHAYAVRSPWAYRRNGCALCAGINLHVARPTAAAAAATAVRTFLVFFFPGIRFVSGPPASCPSHNTQTPRSRFSRLPDRTTGNGPKVRGDKYDVWTTDLPSLINLVALSTSYVLCCNTSRRNAFKFWKSLVRPISSFSTVLTFSMLCSHVIPGLESANKPIITYSVILYVYAWQYVEVIAAYTMYIYIYIIE